MENMHTDVRVYKVDNVLKREHFVTVSCIYHEMKVFKVLGF